MKSFFIAAALFFTVACANAQNYGYVVYLHGGVGLPAAPDLYQQNWQSGPSIGAGVEFTLSQSASIGIGADYARTPTKKFHLTNGTLNSNAIASGGEFEMLSMAAFLNYRILGRIGGTFPYLTVDGGVTHMRMSDQTIISANAGAQTLTGASETAYRASGGAGIDIPVSATVAFSLEVKYISIFAKDDRRSYVPVEAGFKFVF
ncbi:MAG TPA: outer membrane beta-barrel protein [Bacteroidota bacterium]|nr:outer membrane beta-barrel protein [Bacteroidota bacterium]